MSMPVLSVEPGTLMGEGGAGGGAGALVLHFGLWPACCFGRHLRRLLLDTLASVTARSLRAERAVLGAGTLGEALPGLH